MTANIRIPTGLGLHCRAAFNFEKADRVEEVSAFLRLSAVCCLLWSLPRPDPPADRTCNLPPQLLDKRVVNRIVKDQSTMKPNFETPGLIFLLSR